MNLIGVAGSWIWTSDSEDATPLQLFVTPPVVATVSYAASWDVQIPALSEDTPGSSGHAKYPFTVAYLVVLIATLAGAWVSVTRVRPTSARDAVLQGALTSVPHAVGVTLLAILARSDLVRGLQLLGSSGRLSGANFDVPAVAAVALVTGTLMGAAAGLAVWKRSAKVSWRHAVAATGFRFAPQVAGGIAAVTVAFALALVVAGLGAARLIEDVPGQGIPVFRPVEYTTLSDVEAAQLTQNVFTTRAVLAPAFAVEVLGLAHGATLSSENSNTGGDTDSATLSLLGGGAAPWWLYAALLIPALGCFVGGYVTSAVSPRPRSSLPSEASMAAVPYAALIVGLGWLANEATFWPGGSYTGGFDLLILGLAALAWGAALGWLGGRFGQTRVPEEPALAVSTPFVQG